MTHSKDSPKITSEPLPCDKILSSCAQAWELGNMTFVRKMENIVYVCHRMGDKVFLRLTSPLRRAAKEIDAELNWIEHLAMCDVRVPRLIPDKTGKRRNSYTEGKQHFEAVVFSAIEGEHPSPDVAKDPKFLKKLGALIAKMHNASLHYDASHHGHRREEWYEERGIRHALAAAAVSGNHKLRSKFEETVAWMRTLPQGVNTYGLVHADLGALNVFVEKTGDIGIIDFDDSCYHWFAFDLAIVIYSMAGRFRLKTAGLPEEKEWQNTLLEGYRSIRQLSVEEESWIPKFIDFACLRLIFWIEHHESLQTFHDEAITQVANTKQWAINRQT